jgi:hypothetical protein
MTNDRLGLDSIGRLTLVSPLHWAAGASESDARTEREGCGGEWESNPPFASLYEFFFFKCCLLINSSNSKTA